MKPSTSAIITILVILVLGWAVFAFLSKSLGAGYSQNNPSKYATTTVNPYGTTTGSNGGKNGGQVVCTADAMQCPDGSYVGRSGPRCEFVCPPISDNSGKHSSSTVGLAFVYASLQEKITVGGINITPIQVTEDSRCPVDVTCIQAGTVAVMVKVETGDSKQTGAFVLKLDTPVAFAGSYLELYSVLPEANSKTTIEAYDYRFLFRVYK